MSRRCSKMRKRDVRAGLYTCILQSTLIIPRRRGWLAVDGDCPVPSLIHGERYLPLSLLGPNTLGRRTYWIDIRNALQGTLRPPVARRSR